MKPAKKVLRLVPAGPAAQSDPELVDTLRGMLRRALEGRTTGLAWIEITRDATVIDLVGRGATSNLVWTRGAVCSLDDRLGELIHQAAEAAPTWFG